MDERMEIIDQLLRLPIDLLLSNNDTPLKWNHDYGLWIDIQNSWKLGRVEPSAQLLVNSPFSNEELMHFIEDTEVMRIYEWRRAVKERNELKGFEKPTEWTYKPETA